MIKHRGRVLHSSDLCDPLLVKEILKENTEDPARLHKDLVTSLWQSAGGLNPVPSLNLLLSHKRWARKLSDSDKNDLMMYQTQNPTLLEYVLCDKTAPFHLDLSLGTVTSNVVKKMGLSEILRLEQTAVLGPMSLASASDALKEHMRDTYGARFAKDSAERLKAFTLLFSRMKDHEEGLLFLNKTLEHIFAHDRLECLKAVYSLTDPNSLISCLKNAPTSPENCLKFLWTSPEKDQYVCLLALLDEKIYKRFSLFAPEVQKEILKKSVSDVFESKLPTGQRRM